MWAALGSIALMLGLSEASKMIQNWRSLTPNKASQLANEIISAAEKKGGALLNKALTIVQNIPVLSSSQSVKQHIIKARQAAEKNYNDVEKKVADMKLEAQQKATEIQNMPDRSVITAVKDRIKTGQSDLQRAEQMKEDALNKVEQTI